MPPTASHSWGPHLLPKWPWVLGINQPDPGILLPQQGHLPRCIPRFPHASPSLSAPPPHTLYLLFPPLHSLLNWKLLEDRAQVRSPSGTDISRAGTWKGRRWLQQGERKHPLNTLNPRHVCPPMLAQAVACSASCLETKQDSGRMPGRWGCWTKL